MSEWLYTAETGLANGTTVTVANSDDGTAGLALANVIQVNNGTVTYSTDNPIRGALSLRYVATFDVTTVARTDISGLFSTTNFVADMAFRATNISADEPRIVEIICSTGFALRILITSAGKVRLYAADGTIIWTSTTTINTTTSGFRLGFRILQGTTTTGRLEFSLYNTKTATTPTETMTTRTNLDMNTTPITQMRVGKINSQSTWEFFSDDWQFSDTRTTLYGAPPVAGDTVNAGVDQINVEPWTTVTLSALSSSGTVTWSHISGPNPTLSGSGLTRTFVAPPSFTALTSVFRATNGSATDDVSITYLPVTDGIVTSSGPVVVSPIRILRKT